MTHTTRAVMFGWRLEPERPVVVRDLDEVLLPLYNVPQEQWPRYLQAAMDSRTRRAGENATTRGRCQAGSLCSSAWNRLPRGSASTRRARSAAVGGCPGRGAHPSVTGCFQILDFPWSTNPGVIYIEYRSGAFYLEEAHEIEAHTMAFERT
ncbi:MAG: Scr1 family TA system antitoxin-like transcriptional regulator [Pseudonocardiaceae bacterium]